RDIGAIAPEFSAIVAIESHQEAVKSLNHHFVTVTGRRRQYFSLNVGLPAEIATIAIEGKDAAFDVCNQNQITSDSDTAADVLINILFPQHLAVAGVDSHHFATIVSRVNDIIQQRWTQAGIEFILTADTPRPQLFNTDFFCKVDKLCGSQLIHFIIFPEFEGATAGQECDGN